NDTLTNFLQRLVHLKKNILVVGHSNTILPMLDGLHLSHNINVIPDNDYEDFFLVTIKNNKAIKLKESTYGFYHPLINIILK
ncbi:MAG: hypothetical protein M3004_07470, partial [Bacteroidota bacterium]|nr:hypothetical protein [Bacteroidota bacterium]